MSKVKTSRYDTADYLKTEEDIAAYLEAVAEEGDPVLIVAALGDIARARHLNKLTHETGLMRDELCKALSGESDPSFATVMKVAQALGLRIAFLPTKAA